MLVTGVLCAAGGACSTGDDDPTLVGEVPTTVSTTATTVRATTTTAPACPMVSASTADGTVEHEGDVDGDGRRDLVQSFGSDGDGPATVTLLVQLAAGGGATLEVGSAGGAAVELLGTAAVDRVDGRHLLWVRVGAGAASTVVGLYWFDDCELAPVELPNGDPVELPIGGTVRTVAGAECGSRLDPEADLILYEGRSNDGDRYDLTVTEHRYADGLLTPSPDSEPVRERTDDPSRASRLRCGDVEL